MRIEQSAYANRWRPVNPAAKGSFALAGLVAAFLATTPASALGVMLLLAACTTLGAGVPFSLYLRVAAPTVGFLTLSCLTLLVSIHFDDAGQPAWRLAPEALPRIATVASRSLAALAALLGLVLTTPLPDLIVLLRRLRMPEVLLDLMVLCYRMLFVFSSAMQDTLTAQQARLGYGSARRSLRSLGLLTANLAVLIWLRTRCLHQAALSRNSDGPLRFLTPDYPHAGRDQFIALFAGTGLIYAATRLSA